MSVRRYISAVCDGDVFVIYSASINVPTGSTPMLISSHVVGFRLEELGLGLGWISFFGGLFGG